VYVILNGKQFEIKHAMNRIVMGLQMICPFLLSKILWISIIFTIRKSYSEKYDLWNKNLRKRKMTQKLSRSRYVLAIFLLWPSKLPKIWWNNGSKRIPYCFTYELPHCEVKWEISNKVMCPSSFPVLIQDPQCKIILTANLTAAQFFCQALRAL